MPSTESPPAPVDWIVISGSAYKVIRSILIFLLLFSMFLVFIWAQATGNWDKINPEPGEDIVGKWVLPVAFVFVILVMPGLVVTQLRWLWLHRRLVIGPDRLQVIENSCGVDNVVIQIPYQNIAEFGYEPRGWPR